jgi:hypothetical protein
MARWTEYNDSVLSAGLASVMACQDDEFRKNVTMLLTASALRKKGRGSSVYMLNGLPDGASMSVDWLTTGATHWRLQRNRQSDAFFKYPSAAVFESVLKNEFFLTGVTERLHEYLVMLALFHGWDPSALLYATCKESPVRITREEFAQFFPELVEELALTTRSASMAHAWARTQFDELVQFLGVPFRDSVRVFEARLREFRAKALATRSSKSWKAVAYVDGHVELC